MNVLIVSCLLLVVTSTLAGEIKDPCQVKYDCDKITETAAYKKCLHSKRIKRQTCPYANSVQPQIVQAIPVAQPNYQDVVQVQPAIENFQPVQTVMCNAPPCPQPCSAPSCMPTVVTSQNCVNSCTQTCGGLGCRDRCQQSCQPQNAFQNTTSVVQRETRESYATSPNVTTIIKLTNIVNNTNVVNVPTNINNTNVNNLDLGSNITTDQMQQHPPQKCCLVVEPKVCHKLNTTEGGYRCIHRKHHTCGEQCQSRTVHAQVRQPCTGSTTQCPPQVAYVPQPQPTCAYQPSWPYVSCGSQNQQASCSGCYDHYGYGFHNYYGASPPSCVGCYDDGFNQGPLYRQGPYYQPGYYHTPPVQVPQMQAQTQPNCGGFGCFGNQYIDPVFVNPSYSPYSQNYVQQPQFYPQPQQFYPQPQQYYPQPQQYYPQPQQEYYPQQQPYSDYYQPLVLLPTQNINSTNATNNFNNDIGPIFGKRNTTNSTAPEIIPLPWSQPPQPMYYPVPVPAPAPAPYPAAFPPMYPPPYSAPYPVPYQPSYPVSYPGMMPAGMPVPYNNPYAMRPMPYPPMVPYNTIEDVYLKTNDTIPK